MFRAINIVMVKYTKDQETVARGLLKGPRAVEDLRKDTGLALKDINEALKGMINMGVVIKRKDNTYTLIDDVIKGVKKERNFHVKMFIEGMSEDKDELVRMMKNLEQKLREEPLDILEFKEGEPLKQETNYSMFFDLTVAVASFKDIISLIINYGPSSVELLKPSKVELGAPEAHAVLNDMTSAIHHYVGIIMQLRQELIKKGNS